MSGKCRPSLRRKTLENVKRCNLSQTDKDCINAVFERFMPKKIIIQKFPDNPEVDRVPMDIKLHYCPCCNVRFIGWGMKYCGECGQALDWSDTE